MSENRCLAVHNARAWLGVAEWTPSHRLGDVGRCRIGHTHRRCATGAHQTRVDAWVAKRRRLGLPDKADYGHWFRQHAARDVVWMKENFRWVAIQTLDCEVGST